MADLTRQDAEREVARCLGEYASEHDVPAVLDALTRDRARRQARGGAS